ncbi:MAG: dockerin type I domain-containing protein, partial [Candidatus Poribacteria bacterium]|nr:dockerin type I domain-containing protein [Candidatus Poribacteria bacterium]
TIRLWDARTGEHKHTLEGHTHDIWSLAFSPDGGTLASGSEDHTIRLWDIRTGDLLQTLDYSRSVSSVAFFLDDFMLASGGGMIRLWDIRTGEVLHTLVGGDVTFSSDRSTLASGSWGGSILLWDISPYTNLILTRAADVNGDGTVSILDLVLVAAEIGQLGADGADINGDGMVNLQDLELVADVFGNAAASPPNPTGERETLMAEDVRKWLAHAAELEMTDPAVQRGIIALERLLTTLTRESNIPNETALLPNYPNPFNPETWIPYQLKQAAGVKLTIHDVTGLVIRTLEVGYQPAGVYQNRNRAAYWDGRNERGEVVATGVYFCTLTAGAFSATRRMLVNK